MKPHRSERGADSHNSARAARLALVAFAQVAGFAGSQLQEFELAVGDALANAVEHGHVENGLIALEAEFALGAIRVDISDAGRDFAGWENLEPASREPVARRGFGILIMHATTDEIRYLEGGRRIRLTKYLAISERSELQQEGR